MAETAQLLRSPGAGGVTLAAEPSRAGEVVTGPGLWLRRRHSLKVEAAFVVGLYLVYDSSRGLVSGGPSAALAHARAVTALERDVSLNMERGLQHLVGEIPGLMRLFGWGYMGLHLGATVAALVWLHRRGTSRAYAQLRTALLLASLIGLAGFVAFPTAPPRLAALGIADTVSGAGVNLNSSNLHWLYNPYAAMPSLHVAYAVVVGLSIARWAPRRAWRGLGTLYPVWVSVEVVATGNHFLLDVAAGGAVGLVSLLGAHVLVTRQTSRPTLRGAATERRARPEAGPFGPVPVPRTPTFRELVGQLEARVRAGSASP